MSNQKYCGNCGKSVEPDTHFCGSCGAAIEETGLEQKPATPASGPAVVAPPKKGWMKPVLIGAAGMLVALFVLIMLIPVDETDVPETVADAQSQQVEDQPPLTGESDIAEQPQSEAPAPPASQVADLGWQVYLNSRYGTVVQYPAALFDQASAEPDDHSGREFESSDGKTLTIYSSANALEQPVEQLLANYLSNMPTDENVLTSAFIEDGFTVTFNIEGKFVHHTMLTSDDGTYLHRLTIIMPQEQQTDMAQSVADIVKSFRVYPTTITEPEAQLETPAEPQTDTRPNTLSFLRVASSDYGIASQGVASVPDFSLEVPRSWIQGRYDDARNSLVFRSPEGDILTELVLGILVDPLPANGLSAFADDYTSELQSIGDAYVISRQTTEQNGLPAIDLVLELVAPDNLDTLLRNETIFIQKDRLVYRIEITATAADWLLASQVMDQALNTFSF